MIEVEIDTNSGFCFGVVKAVEAAEKAIDNQIKISSLGDIVHNQEEVKRLEDLGMNTINRDKLGEHKDSTILIRAHGEPPTTYQVAEQNNIKIIDATCPVVLRLQQKVKLSHQYLKPLNGQVIIYGKKDHAEVIGLVGQTDGEALVIESYKECLEIDINKPTHIFSQTTKNLDEYRKITEHLEGTFSKGIEFKFFDTICRQVSNRIERLQSFAKKHEVLIFVGGKKSSNAKMLFEKCKQSNANTHFISSPNELNPEWFKPKPKSVGVCGATSTPPWLMDNIANTIRAEEC